MAKVDSIFRKSALDRIASPDRLDTMLKVTSSLSWLALVAAALLVVAVVIWTFWGTIPETCTVAGVISSSYGTNTLFSPVGGMVEELLVEEGDCVVVGTPVARLIGTDGSVTTVLSEQGGTVSAILADTGGTIQLNDQLVRLSPNTDQPLVMFCCVPVSMVGQLEEGMEAVITLSSADSNIYGHMMGHIVGRDSRAMTEEQMSQVLGGENMASLFAYDEPMAAVTIALQGDPDTVSGYYFSAAKGSNVRVRAGDLAQAQITIREDSPISMVFPLMEG